MKSEALNEMIHLLNCVSRLATLENAPKTQVLVKRITDSLRYKHTRKNQILTIREEMKAIENIKEIYKWRMGESLIIQADVEPSCLDIYIPHFSIMAFVQSSLSNALNEREEQWIIKISVKPLNDCVSVRFKDNSIKEILNNLESKEKDREEYDSILNTLERIKSYNSKICGEGFDSISKNDSTLNIKIAL